MSYENFFHNSLLFRGHERIRTAVAGFADQSLAARPRDHYLFSLQNYK